MKLKLIRNVSQEECPWLDKPFKTGEEVYKYSYYTYGCITETGIACSLEKDKEPFFELPASALETIKQ